MQCMSASRRPEFLYFHWCCADGLRCLPPTVAGTLVVKSATVVPRPSFLDYIAGARCLLWQPAPVALLPVVVGSAQLCVACTPSAEPCCYLDHLLGWLFLLVGPSAWLHLPLPLPLQAVWSSTSWWLLTSLPVTGTLATPTPSTLSASGPPSTKVSSVGMEGPDAGTATSSFGSRLQY